VRSVLPVASVVSAVLCSPSAAQETKTGTLVPGRESSSMIEENGLLRKFTPPSLKDRAQRRANAGANETMRGFTTCLADTDNKREHEALVSFLKLPPEDGRTSASARKLSRPECLYGAGADYVTVRYSNDLLRGGLFRALYLNTLRSPPRKSVDRQEIESVWNDLISGNFGAMIRYGDCIVASDKSAAEAFLTSRVDSAEQSAAVRKLGPTLGKCLKPGATLQLSRMVLEGVLAEALYRRATAVGTTDKVTLQ
jgi:hypothetical protein